MLPIADKKVKSISRYKDNNPVKYSKTKEGILLELEETPSDIDHVIEITWK